VDIAHASLLTVYLFQPWAVLRRAVQALTMAYFSRYLDQKLLIIQTFASELSLLMAR
jgi:hypothetical protein